MNSAYDLIVVGGGPAGLTSAKVAAENGLSVALIERKDNAQDILRMCGMMLVTLSSSYMGERVIHNEEKGLLCFPLHGFSLKYDGPTKDFFSKNLLLSGLVEECKRLGVNFFTGENVIKAGKDGEGVEVITAAGKHFKGVFAIAA
ncbi:MAG: NAD(P)/FAD-dependent oxidoreductase, partial [Deltaproteobacteria bacterium]|nr:NAD(P)/FAD-dependent oxidoreductase [Deltaproteobacteria bacterium]